ncbi:MAG: hypothetical protein AAGM22_18240 [Acidobacteriota bacterium]
MAEDEDFDGLGDGFQLNGTLTERGEAALVDGSSLDIRLSFSVDEEAEDFAVDNLFVTEAPVIDWTAAPPLAASFFDAANWSTGAIPTDLDDVAIRNGGSARSEGPANGDPGTAEVANLTLGDSLGSDALELSGVELIVGFETYIGGQQPLAMPNQGTFSGTNGRLEVRDAATFDALDTVNVGEVWSRGTASIESRGDLILEDITSAIFGGQLDIGGTRAIASSTATSTATVTARNLGALTTTGDLDLCDTLILGPGTGVCEAQALFENITQLSVFDDVEVGDAIADAGQSMTSRSVLEIVDVASFVILDDLELLTEDRVFPGNGPAQNDIEATVRLVRTGSEMSGSLGVGDLELIPDSFTRGVARLELIDSSLRANAGMEGTIGFLSGGADTGSTILDAKLSLSGSWINHRGPLSVGFTSAAPASSLRAEIELDEGSVLSTEQLNIGPEGTLRLHLDGLTGAVLPSPGASALGGQPADTYSAISILDATLGGEVIAQFDFLPPAGTHTFDLINSGNVGALADTTATLTVEGLDGGFTVSSLGVVTDGIDKLRLVITGTPLETDLSATLDDGIDEVLADNPVTYTAVISNQGPEPETGAAVSGSFPSPLENCTWTSSASGGASGNGSGSGASLEEQVDLPSGAQVTYSITCTVGPLASGPLEASISVTGFRNDTAPANNAASDINKILIPVDLAVTLDDGEPSAIAGDTRVYALVVTNVGPRDTVGAVSDIFPPELTMCSWSCTPSPGALCTALTVDGDLTDDATLPAGTSATYTAACLVDPALDPATLEIVNTATVTVPADAIELVPANNTAQDVNGGPAALLFRSGFESGDTDDWTATFPPQP